MEGPDSWTSGLRRRSKMVRCFENWDAHLSKIRWFLFLINTTQRVTTDGDGKTWDAPHEARQAL